VREREREREEEGVWGGRERAGERKCVFKGSVEERNATLTGALLAAVLCCVLGVGVLLVYEALSY
jgi:hypothetical protein